MNQWLELLLTGVVAGLVGSAVTYFFALKQDKEARRRDRTVSHLMEAYRNIEDAVERRQLTDEQLERLETSIAATFLMGSKDAAQKAKDMSIDSEEAKVDMLPLLQQLRKDLRRELGLESHDVEIKFLRLPRNKGKTT